MRIRCSQLMKRVYVGIAGHCRGQKPERSVYSGLLALLGARKIELCKKLHREIMVREADLLFRIQVIK